VKREIICPVCDRDLVKVVAPTYPLLNAEFEGVRRRRGRARLPMRCDQCNGEIPLLGLCMAWSIYRGSQAGAELGPPRHGSEYFEWEASRVELMPAPLPLAPWHCAHCKSELEVEDAAQCIVQKVTDTGEPPERLALPGSFHRWCIDAATNAFVSERLAGAARAPGR